MAVSDAVYGPTRRYVSRPHLEAMLEHEFAVLRDRLGPRRGDSKCFFAFADTVANASGHGNPRTGTAGSASGSRPDREEPFPNRRPCSPERLDHRAPAETLGVLEST